MDSKKLQITLFPQFLFSWIFVLSLTSFMKQTIKNKEI